MKELLNIPNVESINDFSNLINISTYNLFKISKSPERFYKKIEVPKRNGKVRILASPSYKIKAIQAWILRNILANIPIDKHSTGYSRYNLSENVRRHIGNTFLLCLDIEDFFPSIKREKVYDLFSNLGFNNQMSVFFTNMCIFEGGLPQGGVTSPALSNILNKALDKEIFNFCSKNGLTYTRYADDITVSSNNRTTLKEAQEKLIGIINSHGYRLNKEKSRILHPGMQRRVTGLIYNEDNEVRIGYKRKKNIRAKIHTYFNKNLETSEKEELHKHLVGWMSFLKCNDPKTHQQLSTYWAKQSQQKALKETASSNDED